MNDLTIFEKEELTIEEEKFMNLHNRIIIAGKSLTMQLYEFSKLMYEMYSSKDYKIAGYEKFEDYTFNVLGIKKSQAYNYVSIYETYSSDFFQLIGKSVSMTKLLILSKLGDEEKALDYIANNDVDNMTVKKLTSEIEDLKSQIDLKNISIKDDQKKLAEKAKIIDDLVDKYDSVVEENQSKEAKIYQLQLDIEKLQNNSSVEIKEVIKEIKVEDTARIDELEKLLNLQELETEELKDKLAKAKNQKKEVKTLKEENEKLKEENETLEKKIKLSSNEDFSKFKAMFNILQKEIKDILFFVNELLDLEFQNKCYLALNKLFEGAIHYE